MTSDTGPPGAASTFRIVTAAVAAVVLLGLGGWRIIDAVRPDDRETKYVCPGTTVSIQAAPLGGGPATTPPARLSDEPC